MLIKTVLVATALLGIAGLFATPKRRPQPAPAVTAQCCEFPPPPPGCPPNCVPDPGQ